MGTRVRAACVAQPLSTRSSSRAATAQPLPVTGAVSKRQRECGPHFALVPDDAGVEPAARLHGHRTLVFETAASHARTDAGRANPAQAIATQLEPGGRDRGARGVARS